MKTIKVSGVIIIIAIIILIVTNPSYTKFKNFYKDIPIKGIYVNTKQVSNEFIFSVYIKEVVFTQYDEFEDIDQIRYIERTKYIGILSNFFELSKQKDKSQTGKIIEK